MALFDARVTAVAEEAAAERVRVQVLVPAPVRLFGLQTTPESVVGGATVSCAVAVPLRVAVRVAGVERATVPAVAVKEAEVEPWLTTTLAGTVTEAFEEAVPKVAVTTAF